MLKLIIGRAGTGKSTQVLRRLCAEGALRPQILIVPEPRSHETERALCAMGGPTVSLWAEVLSFSRLATRIFQCAGGTGVTELDAGGRLLLMHRAVSETSAGLTVYRRPSRKASFLRSLLDTVDELKDAGVQPDILIRAGEDRGGEEGQRLRDLGVICAAYQALTASVSLDPRDRLTRAAQRLEGFSWAEGKDVWVDGFVDFTAPQSRILRLLMQQANSVTVTLTCDHIHEDEEGMGIFSPARRTAMQLRRLAEDAGVPFVVEQVDPAADTRRPAMRAMEQGLFAAEEVEPVPAQGAVELFRGGNMRGEVEWVASRIRTMVREDGLRLRDIGVVARDYESYRHLVESVFPRYEVPVFSSAMTDILERPVLSLVTAVLEILTSGYTYDSVFRYLKTGLTDLSQSDRDELENYVLRWDIRGARWKQQKAWAWHPRGYGYPLEEEDRQLLVRLDVMRRNLVEPLEKLKQNANKTGRGQAIALYTFMEEIGLPQRLEERVEQLKGEGRPALADEYRQLWEILCGALEQCAELLGDAEMELDEFAPLLRLVLSQYDVGSIPVSLDRVTAGETTRQTGHAVRVLFLLGADDSTIPRASFPPGLLTDEDRSYLTLYQAQLHQTARELLGREMTTVYQLCSIPREKLIVTWPAVGPGGEERRPCFLAQRLMHLLSDVQVVTEDALHGSFRLGAPLPALEQAGRDELARAVLHRIPDYAGEVERLEQASRWNRGSLSPEAVEGLYGRRIPMSASRMDKYRSCHFSYFMRYGLKAEPRRQVSFAAPEYGTFVHYVLEHVLQDEFFGQQTMGETELTQEEKQYLHGLTKQVVDRYIKEELGSLEDQSDRFRYLFGRLLRSVYAVVENVAQELRCSKFKPISFELGFGSSKDAALPPVELTVDGVTISISGFVDRVDGWVKDDRLCLRVVDYKTGRKSFDLTEIWNGLGLQMLLYLFTLQEKGEKIYHMPVDSVGVLYMPARDAVIQAERTVDDEQLKKQLDKALVRSGLVLDDPDVLDAMEDRGEGGFRFLPLKVSKKDGKISGEALATAEQFGKLAQHIQTVLEEICRELARGDITADPYWRGPDKNACRYCEYAAACQFEEGRGGDCRRWMPTVKAQQFWNNMEQIPDEGE